ncbi:SIS domain-containing protein [Candidatus Bipolaricaulota bacterium]|nr:SIS domain-containing protein [Candidatus Bipolaricaulota bacterium]
MTYGASYLERAAAILGEIREKQGANIAKAADVMAEAIANGGLVHVFGSGHSVIPVLDIFPRYGSFPGFHPLLDPRLMWFNVLGPGGVRELLWLERQEGYISVFLRNFKLLDKDVLLVFSHGGLNAAPVEAALEAKRLGLTVVAVTSLENHRRATATHSSGKKLADLADIVIDNCVPPEDALVKIEGVPEKVAAGSTLAVVAITMSLVAEVAGKLAEKGISLPIFVSPNVSGFPRDHNEKVFCEYVKRLKRR